MDRGKLMEVIGAVLSARTAGPSTERMLEAGDVGGGLGKRQTWGKS